MMSAGDMDISNESEPPTELDADEMVTKMRQLNKKFRNSCSQVILLNNKIEYLQSRYDRAVKSNKRSYRYFLRLRLATLEGIRNMFYEYACRRADELDEMQDTLVQEGIIDSDFDMEASDSENETAPTANETEEPNTGDSELDSGYARLPTSPPRIISQGTLESQSVSSPVGETSHVQTHGDRNVLSSGATSDVYFAMHNSHTSSHNEESSNSYDSQASGSQEIEQDIVIEGALDTVVMDTQSDNTCTNIIQDRRVEKETQDIPFLEEQTPTL